MPEAKEPKVVIARNYLLPVKEQGAYTVTETELRRLERMVDRIDQRGGFNQNMGFGGFGGVIGTGTALIGLSTTQNVATWCWALCWSIFAVSFAIMVIGFVNSRREGQNLQVSKQAILDEFKVIRESVDAPAAEATALAERT